jgi:hypothetical protein
MPEHENNNEEIIVDEDSELFRIGLEEFFEDEKEREENERVIEEVEQLYENYKENLTDPAFQEYQKEIVRRATQPPPLSTTSDASSLT